MLRIAKFASQAKIGFAEPGGPRKRFNVGLPRFGEGRTAEAVDGANRRCFAFPGWGRWRAAPDGARRESGVNVCLPHFGEGGPRKRWMGRNDPIKPSPRGAGRRCRGGRLCRTTVTDEGNVCLLHRGCLGFAELGARESGGWGGTTLLCLPQVGKVDFVLDRKARTKDGWGVRKIRRHCARRL